MIDQQLPQLLLPRPERRSRRRLRRLGTAALVVLGLAGGYFVTLPVVTSVLWVSGSYLLFGDRGVEYVVDTLEPHEVVREELPDAGSPPTPPVTTRDAEGAAAAARHVVAAYEHSLLSGDPSALEAVSTARCATCTFVTKAMHRAQEQDVRFFGLDVEPTTVAVTSFTPERAVVHLTVTTSDAYVRFSGTDIQGLGGGTTEDDVVLVWAGDRWLADSLDGGLWAPGPNT